MEKLADISSFESFGHQNGSCMIENVIDKYGRVIRDSAAGKDPGGTTITAPIKSLPGEPNQNIKVPAGSVVPAALRDIRKRLNIKPNNNRRIFTKNAINLTKTPAGGGIDLTKKPAGGGVNLSKDNLRPYFGMIADGIGGLLASGVTPNSILRYCQQRISQSTQFDQQRAQQMGKNMSGSVMGMLKQHARAVPMR